MRCEMIFGMTRRELLAAAAVAAVGQGGAKEPIKAGAFAVDITPEKFPVIVNGGFNARKASRANDRLRRSKTRLHKRDRCRSRIRWSSLTHPCVR